VIRKESDEASKTAAPAMSWGCPRRPSGVWASICFELVLVCCSFHFIVNFLFLPIFSRSRLDDEFRLQFINPITPDIRILKMQRPTQPHGHAMTFYGDTCPSPVPSPRAAKTILVHKARGEGQGEGTCSVLCNVRVYSLLPRIPKDSFPTLSSIFVEPLCRSSVENGLIRQSFQDTRSWDRL
jgi:hypothetical protein